MATKLPSFLKKPLGLDEHLRPVDRTDKISTGQASPKSSPTIFRAKAPSLVGPTDPAPQPTRVPKQIFKTKAPALLAPEKSRPLAPIFQSRPPSLFPQGTGNVDERPPKIKAQNSGGVSDPASGPGPLRDQNTMPMASGAEKRLSNSSPMPVPRAPKIAPNLPGKMPAATLRFPRPKSGETPARPSDATSATSVRYLPAPVNGYRIVPLPRLAQGGRWRTEAMRSYSGPVLLWFTRGQGRITVAGTTRGFTSHNAVYLPAGTMHGFEMSGQVYGHAVFFPRDAGLDLPDRPHHLRFRDAVEQNELTQMIEHLQREIDRNLPVAERAMTLHAGLLAVWLQRQIMALDPTETLPSAAKRLAAAFTALVERDFRDGRTIADYALDLGVTPTHLTRSCNSACGRSAHDILADRVFFEARSLLRDTRKPVKEIAKSLGFASAAYFTRAFQKATGQTPTAFRKGS